MFSMQKKRSEKFTCKFVTCLKYFKRTKSNEGLCDSRDHRTPFVYLITVIPYVSGHVVIACYTSCSSRCWYA